MFHMIYLETRDFIFSNTKVFILSVLAFTCSCVAINITLTNYSLASEEQAAVEESYGDKAYYKIWLNGDEETFGRIFGGDYAENIKAALEQLKSEDLFQYRYVAENLIEFYDDDNSDYGAQNFPAYPEECLTGYEDGEAVVYEDYMSLKAFYVDDLFSEEPNVLLSSGEWFDEADFYVDSLDDIQLPVILGSAYEGMYAIGDQLTEAHIATYESITLTVVGFVEEGSYFYDNNNDKNLLNRYMLVPAVETTYDYISEDGSYDSFFEFAYDDMKIMNARVICNEAEAEEVEKRVYEILNQNELYELKLIDETGGMKREIESLKELTVSCTAISVFIVLLSVIMFCIQLYYKLLKNKKKYSIFLMSGITKKQLVFLTIIDTFAIFLVSNVLFVIIYFLFYNKAYLDLGLTRYTIIVLPVMECLLLFFMGAFGYKKVEQLNMSSALRENE